MYNGNLLLFTSEIVWLNVLLSTIGKFSITATFGTVYVYAIEIYPTPVRSVPRGPEQNLVVDTVDLKHKLGTHE